MTEEIKVDQELDCSGLSCPIPVLKTKKAINALSSGQVLKVTSTDPGSNKDMPSWCKRTGNPILKQEDQGNSYIFFIQRK
ncbi:MAG: sulfurtransferase TusA family protein [SAR324 cluster bacterium]|jgi:tRNA 2-thiouridine synthesizing protein A|nr:sulfurtransferase TusA family protein [SAR324 cluster bacterium]MEE1577862.1 sulfurtransferase TusA family protein [Deltaproteobacteria bacterium]MDP7137068.1 sulfurtransferase TusA family protein [SAR324 cluster bacterium]MDP7332867.1 sulfurtransferase TusA family protein [SAR324 cluster bacterium]MDP7498056.1 sulfurtransferase TusA family protein [SAR324 cluster bacterium]|tara:strand:+ start:591 stop:830 length:240 start_codon:yes stop_codon:yes gene_type:complete